MFSDWLCRLTPVLVDALVEDEVLRECKAICALKPDFAAVVSEAEMIVDMVPDGLLSCSHLIQENGIRYTTHVRSTVECRWLQVFPFCVLDAVCKDSSRRRVANSFRQYFGCCYRLTCFFCDTNTHETLSSVTFSVTVPKM